MSRGPHALGIVAALAAGGVALAAVGSSLVGRDGAASPPPRPSAEPSTAAATTIAAAPLAALPAPGAPYANDIVVATDGRCRLYAHVLGSSLDGSPLAAGGLDGCSVRWSPDARYAVALTDDPAARTVVAIDTDGGRRTVSGPVDEFQRPLLAVSTAGRIALCADGRTTRLLPRGRRLAGCAPAFSGDRLLLARENGDIVDADGTTVVPHRLLPPHARVLALAAATDGAHVALLVGSQGRGYVVLAPLAGAGPTRRVDLGVSAVAAAPAGTADVDIAVAAGGQGAIVRLGDLRAAVSFASGRIVRNAAGADLRGGAFSPDGSNVLLATDTATYLADTRTLTPANRASFGAASLFWPDQPA